MSSAYVSQPPRPPSGPDGPGGHPGPSGPMLNGPPSGPGGPSPGKDCIKTSDFSCRSIS